MITCEKALVLLTGEGVPEHLRKMSGYIETFSVQDHGITVHTLGAGPDWVPTYIDCTITIRCLPDQEEDPELLDHVLGIFTPTQLMEAVKDRWNKQMKEEFDELSSKLVGRD